MRDINTYLKLVAEYIEANKNNSECTFLRLSHPWISGYYQIYFPPQG